MTTGLPFQGYGATLSVSTDGGSTYTVVTNLIKINKMPSINAKTGELTGLSATALGKTKGILDYGDAEFTVSYSQADTTHKSLAALAVQDNTGAVPYWKIIPPKANATDTPVNQVFSGFVNKFECKGFDGTNQVMTDIGIAVQGAGGHGYLVS